MDKNLPILTLKFKYDGSYRFVENVTLEDKTVIGMERRKNGKFSNRIKRYSFDKMQEVEYVE